MTYRQIVANQRVYTFCPDDTPALAHRTWSVLRAIIRDEITQQAPRTDLRLTTNTLGLTPRVAAGGLVGLIGNPGRLFSGLDGATADVDLTISAERYITRHFRELLGPVVGFPHQFQPLDLGIVALHREAVVICGRIVQHNGLARTPLAGVEISITGLWPTFPAADVDPATEIQLANIVSLHPGIYAQRTAGLSALRRRNMILAIGEEKTLLASASQGHVQLRLSDRINLHIGEVLALEPDDTERAEFITVSGVEPASTDDQPARITLTHPLAYDHRAGITAVRATPQAPGPDNTFTRDAIPGDQMAFLNGLADLSGATIVEVTGGPSDEYHKSAAYHTVSGPDGYFRLPPLSRVAQLRLHAERADLPALVDLTISPDYRYYENRTDMVFP